MIFNYGEKIFLYGEKKSLLRRKMMDQSLIGSDLIFNFAALNFLRILFKIQENFEKRKFLYP